MKLSQVPKKQWVKFIIVCLLYLLFLLWCRSLLGLVVLPFIFDAYITKFIPWGFWRDWENTLARDLMGWIDAIVFAVIAVYFVNVFAFQNYQIPSSSLEKSLMVGDYLYVSKLSYGPRIPNTPLTLPFTQHSLPGSNKKSYIEWPSWGYKRIPGFGNVKHNDIVVFNFPAGDTVAVNYQQTDFYTLAYEEGKQALSGRIAMDSLTKEQERIVYDLYYAEGRRYILRNPRIFGEVITRPVDRRENYVKRCVGLPGDMLEIKDTHVYINGERQEDPEFMQLNYFVQTTGEYISDEQFKQLGISKDDQWELGSDSSWRSDLLAMGLSRRSASGVMAPVYHLPLTKGMIEELNAMGIVSGIAMEPASFSGDMYPLNKNTGWDRDNYGPVWIPSKGATIDLSLDNLPIYERCIHAYEGNDLQVKDGVIYINNEPATSYTFKMDYYWMMGDNRHNSADSRYWGFVPEDHIVGQPKMIWMSIDKDYALFDGGIRWNRLFRSAGH